MEVTRLPKQLFYDDVATGTRRPEGPKRRYKGTLKNSIKRLYINPKTWEQTGAAIYEANRIAAKREAHKSQISVPSLPTIRRLKHTPRCQRAFRARIGLVGHLRTCSLPCRKPRADPHPRHRRSRCCCPIVTIRPAPAPASTATASITTTSSRTPPTSIHLTHRPGRSLASPSHRDWQTSGWSINLHSPHPSICLHCIRTLAHRTGLLGHMHIHESPCSRQPPAISRHHIFSHQHPNYTTPSPITSTSLSPSTKVESALLGSLSIWLNV
ncbi:hypothetical protein SprV_0401659900 [Sparganum proliferum]